RTYHWDSRLQSNRGLIQRFPNQAYAYFLRSPHAHARIRAIDAGAALAIKGVLAVLTAKEMLADGVKPVPHVTDAANPHEPTLKNPPGFKETIAPHTALAVDKARYVGEAVAIIIAERVNIAKDAAEAVNVDYEVLPAVSNAPAAAAPGAPKLWDSPDSNISVDAEVGDKAATEAAFARAAHIAKFDTLINRVTGVPMEPRAAVAQYDSATQRYTLHAGSGGAVRLKQDLAKMLDVPAQNVRVLMDDIGGNYGTRGMIYPEFAAVTWAARRVGRPVKWTCERSEAFLCDYQARELAVSAELALDAQGNFLAMRGVNLSNVGSHPTNYGPLKKGVEIMSSLYRVPAAHFKARGVVSNTMITRPYRSSGRPEVTYVMERLIDIAAREFGFDRAELRRRNLLKSNELPYTNPFGMVYDSGDYPDAMEKAFVLGDWQGFAARRVQAKARGKLRGIGVANYVDTATGTPRERAEITVHPDGTVDVVLGIVSNGQGHETTFAQLINEWLGTPIENVRLIVGDTDIVQVGGGTHSGRGMRLGSIVIWNESNKIIEKAKRIAARLMECEPSIVTFMRGRFSASGTSVTVTLTEVAAAMQSMSDLPSDLRGPLADFSDETIHTPSFPYGCHVCEVEIDPALGTLEIVKYSAIDDVGLAINPMVVHGQVHGGIAQGVGQALWERIYYDPASGQLLSGSFMDYAMPRADHFPFFDAEFTEVPCVTHPLGMRPAGEGGTTPALGVVINAVVDALSDYGVKHIEMPATPERIWRAIQRLPTI
ncbi:MAG: xanthine dehydrogenase family protein molybdopterin-binding subunit, partial [Betaproteobacteria bacterium]|nr:xanthine dehydrogenase family protein molybdopterin-binding subunit [Betaproteobacteria bacterium]